MRNIVLGTDVGQETITFHLGIKSKGDYENDFLFTNVKLHTFVLCCRFPRALVW